MASTRTKFYLDKKRAKWSGVCAGIADYTGINVLWVRLAAIVATVTFAFPWTLVAYWIAAKSADAKPIELYHPRKPAMENGRLFCFSTPSNENQVAQCPFTTLLE